MDDDTEQAAWHQYEQEQREWWHYQERDINWQRKQMFDAAIDRIATGATRWQRTQRALSRFAARATGR